MKKFIPKEKLGKKARKQLDTEQRSTWAFSPVTKRWKAKSCTTAREKPMTVMMITARAFLWVHMPVMTTSVIRFLDFSVDHTMPHSTRLPMESSQKWRSRGSRTVISSLSSARSGQISAKISGSSSSRSGV